MVFAIGSKAGGYTPGAVRNQVGKPGDFYFAVFDSVKTDIFTGSVNTDGSVNKTWKGGKI
ncbi:MAG: hypothetical protein EOP51_06475 [Sphingobacteriales bacterium]|nr:MAG: hypothetical protein EOP51_06475 [Sphingobacteriales bacterium]